MGSWRTAPVPHAVPNTPSIEPTMTPREMRDRVAATDWARTPLGPREGWPKSLQVAVGICLGSRFPMFVWWGPQLIKIYNDAYIPMLGKRHPDALGRPARGVWSDIWPVLEPQVEAVLERGEATWNDRVLLLTERNGYEEETYFTWSYSPIPDDSGGIGGLFCAVTEETPRVFAERERARLLEQVETERARMGQAFARSPAFVAVMRGPDHVFELVNEQYSVLIGSRDCVGKSVREVLPEVAEQGFLELLDRVYATGEPFVGRGARILLRREPDRPLEESFLDFVYQPMRGADGAIDGVLAHGIDVTERKRRGARDAFMLALEEALRPVTDAAEITALGARLLGEHLGADRCAYADVEPDQDTCNVIGDFRRGVPSLVGRYRFADFGEEILRLMRQGRPCVVHDVETHHPPLDDLTDYRRIGIRSMVCVPLLKAGRFVAAMSVHQTVPRMWSHDDVDLLEHVANRCWEAIERARIEQALRESEARFRSMSDHAPVMIRVTGPDARCEYLNARWYAFTGQRQEDALGGGWWDAIHPDDVERAREAYRAAHELRVPFELEYRLQRADGEHRWCVDAATPRWRSGDHFFGYIGSIVDITDHKRALEALASEKTVLELIATGSPLPTVLGAIVRSVEAQCPVGTQCALSVLDERGEPVGRSEPAGWPDPGRPPACTMSILGADGRELGTVTLAFREPRQPSEHELGLARSATHLAGIVIEKHHVDSRLQQSLAAERDARSDAERASRMKDEFLANLSHELRTPLNAILGWSRILGRGDVTPDTVAKGAAVIQRNASAQARIIEDLLDMSAILSGKVRLDVQPFDLAEIAESAVDTARPTADTKGIHIHADLGSRVGTVTRGDPGRIQQVLWNLLSNAIKFTPRGGTIEVVLRHEQSHVEIEVRDTGEGIRPEFLPFVFGRFRQADASTTRAHGGLGLGLSIVKQLVELHGGVVRAESAGPGQGATFVVELPVAAVAPPSAAARAHPRVSARSVAAGAEIAALRVLVVDDEPDAREVVARLLEEEHAIVTAAGSAKEALERLEKERFDVLVSDIGMPGEDGYSLIRRVRSLGAERGGNVPAVALTAYARAEDRVRAIRAGFQMHVSKPVEPAELLAIVASLGGGSRQG